MSFGLYFVMQSYRLHIPSNFPHDVPNVVDTDVKVVSDLLEAAESRGIRVTRMFRPVQGYDQVSVFLL